MESKDRDKLCELRKKFNRSRKRIGELTDELQHLTTLLGRRSREAKEDAKLAYEAREAEKCATSMFIACYNESERSRPVVRGLFGECVSAILETRCDCHEGSGICEYCTPKADLLHRIRLFLGDIN